MAERASPGVRAPHPHPHPRHQSGSLSASPPSLSFPSPAPGSRVAGDGRPLAGRGSTERPGASGRAPPPAGPAPPGPAAQIQEAAAVAATRTVRAAAAEGPGRHGGRRAPRLRAQDQQVARPPGPLLAAPRACAPPRGSGPPRPGRPRPSPFRLRRVRRGRGRREGGGVPAGIASGRRAGWRPRSTLRAVRPGGVARGPSWRRRCREGWAGVLGIASGILASPGPRSRVREWGAAFLSIPCPVWSREFGDGIALLAAFESRGEVSRAPPSPGSRAQLSGGVRDSCGCPPARPQAVLAPAGRAGMDGD